MDYPSKVYLGTRSSPLSLMQTDYVLNLLRTNHPNIEFIIVKSTTRGDQNKNAPLESMDRGMFSSDISSAVLSKTIDCALHSAKDLPVVAGTGLLIAGVPKRSDPRDVLITKWRLPLDQLPSGARLGTSSLRRKIQIQHIRPDIEILPIRGNVGTRIDKAMNSTDYDGVILAASGLIRLGIQDKIDHFLPTELCTPDIGQGTLVLEAQKDNILLAEILSKITHRDTLLALTAERSFVSEIGSNCSTPHAAFAEVFQDSIQMQVMVASENSRELYRTKISCDIDTPNQAGKIALTSLINQGADIPTMRDKND